MPIARLPSQLLAVLALFVLTGNLFAAQPITDKLIDNWIASQKALQAWGDKHEAEIAKYEEQIDMTQVNPLDFSAETMLKPLKASGLYGQAEDIVTKHNFDNLEQWADLTIRITKIAASIEMEKAPGAFDTSEIEAMLGSGQIPPEQEAMMRQAIEQAKALRAQLSEGISQAERQAIQPYLPQIMQLMEGEP